MREIKFRAWINKREMLSSSRTELEISLRGFTQSPDYILMQYIGRKDKNGKEIYEGDILIKDSFGRNLKVYWTQEHTGFWVEPIAELAQFGDLLGHYNQEDIEVIGNIYEHSFLLDTKTEK